MNQLVIIEATAKEQEEEDLSYLKNFTVAHIPLMTDKELDYFNRYAANQRAIACCCDKDDHDANLALFLSENQLSALYGKLEQSVRWDIDKKARMDAFIAEALRWLGLDPSVDVSVTQNLVEACTNSSNSTLPLILIAVYEFIARSLPDLFPPGDRVKAKLIGKPNKALIEQGDRVAGFMNYQYSTQMRGVENTERRMLFSLALLGSAFIKLSYDPISQTPEKSLIPLQDFIVCDPDIARNLHEVRRYTHRFNLEYSEILSLQATGFFRECEIVHHTNYQYVDRYRRSEVTAEENRLSQFTPEQRDYSNTVNQHVIYEVHAYLDLDYLLDNRSQKQGIAKPYVIYLDIDSKKVLAIRREWKRDDPTLRRTDNFIHYTYFPSTTFYGHGLIHTALQMQKDATSGLNMILEASKRVTFTSGYIADGLALTDKDNNTTHIPEAGQYLQTTNTMDELRNMFYSLPTSNPPSSLLNAVKLLENYIKETASITDISTGGIDPRDAKTGAVLALDENAKRRHKEIYLNIYRSFEVELKRLAEINYEYLPDEYPYSVGSISRHVFKHDFDGRLDIIPVADTHAIDDRSQRERIETVLQLANSNPQLYNMTEVHRKVLEILHIPYINTILIDNNAIPQLDPVSEGERVLQNKPIKAYLDQDHDAHLIVHEQFLNSLPDMIRKQIEPILIAHIADHIGKKYRITMQKEMGLVIPIMDDDNKEGMDSSTERMITAKAAEVAQVMAKQQQEAMANQQNTEQTAPTEGNVDPLQLQLALKEKELELDHQVQIMRVKQEQERKDMELAAQLLREERKNTAEIERKNRAAALDKIGNLQLNAATRELELQQNPAKRIQERADEYEGKKNSPLLGD